MDFAIWFEKIIHFLFQAGIILATLSILVVLHEFGHFLAARFFGVGVLEFSFGMGKLLFSKKRKDTEYQIRLIPMGGFVKLKGEESIENPMHEPMPDEFYGVSPLKRLGIVFAGPVMNMILAFVVFVLVMFFMGENTTKPVLGFLKEDSVAYKHGLRSKDTVAAVNKVDIRNFEDFSEMISTKAGEKVLIDVLRGEAKLTVEVIPESKAGMDLLGDEIIYGDIGVSPATFPLIGGVKPKSPAEKCGLVKGDILKAVNEKEIIYWEEIVYIIQDNPLKTLKLSWLRNGKLMNAEITPEKKKIKIGDKEKEVGSIGVSASLPESMVIHRNVGFAEAFTTGAQRIYLYTVLTYKVLKKMILGKVSKDNLMGPVRLAGMATDFANEGFFPWLLFLGIVSHQLAIINLLPFPALDGGHAVFFIYEFIFRRKVSFKVLDIANRIGFSFLIALFIFVMGNDLLNIFKG